MVPNVPTPAAPREWTDRRAEILSIAAGLFATRGVEQTSMRDVGRAAGILGGSLYHHFESKQAMLNEILVEYLVDLVDRFDRVRKEHLDPLERLEGLIRSSFESIALYPDACQIWQDVRQQVLATEDSSRFRTLSQGIQQQWIDVVKAGIASGRLRDDIDPTTFYRLARGAIWSAVSLGNPFDELPYAQLADEFVAVLMDGFTARRPPV